jgi:hypothetical protein
MTIGLFLAIAISLFSVSGAVILLWRYRDWRFGFLAGLSLFASAWVLAVQASHLLAQREGWSASLSGLESTYPAMVMSLMALCSIFFLERAISARIIARWCEYPGVLVGCGRRHSLRQRSGRPEPGAEPVRPHVHDHLRHRAALSP